MGVTQMRERVEIEVRNPRTGRSDYSFLPTTHSELAGIVERARAAQVGWQGMGLEGRVEVLSRWRDRIAASQPQLIEAVSRDTGRVAESEREAGNMGKWIDRWADAARLALKETAGPTNNPAFECRLGFAPIPLVGVISPWNFPMSLSVMDAIPALLAGCSVIIKPSEITPRFVEPLVETFSDIPELDGVLTYILGAGDLGAALVDMVDGVCFTGSTATGRKVAAQAGARLIPFFVELGGKDPCIVLEGSNMDLATSAIVTGATLGTGQQCYSLERLYVARPLHDEFVSALVKKAKKLSLGLPTPADGRIGPLIHAPQADIIAEHIADAVAKGAVIHCGGEIHLHGGGCWVEPTVLTNVSHDMKVMTEETFGPLMPVMAFDTVEQAISLANDSEYGLNGAVFGPRDAAVAVAQRMNSGGICVNDAGASPFFVGDTSVCGSDSFNQSGIGGTRHGPHSILRFVRQKMILVNDTGERSPWWFDV